MGRKVGSFTDPTTGEKNWLDVSTVKNIKLSPVQIVRLENRNTYETMVQFKLSNIDMLNVVTIVAEFEHNKKMYRSDAQHIDELKFAEHLAEAVYSEETIDSAQFMIDMKESAMEDLRGSLLVDKILIDETTLSGGGYVYSSGKKVMTIDELVVKVSKNSTIDTKLNNCVGPISLSNLIDPEIVFMSSGIEFRISDFEIISEAEGRIKNYELSISDISMDDAQEDIFFKPFSLDEYDDEVVAEFIVNRTEMLDSLMDDDNSLDDRFDDIL